LAADNNRNVDVAVIGAGAAGLMCAIEAGKRGRRVVVLDHANKPGKKILMSGGGRCNFTNLSISHDNYISSNRHFCKSALSRFTQQDFIDLVNSHGIAWHEKEHGQLFCDNSSRDILDMLLTECRQHDVAIRLDCEIGQVGRTESGFVVTTASEEIRSQSLVVASGGLSIPKMCASPIGYRIAEQFGLSIQPTRAGLVPFTLHPEDKQRLASLSGIAVDVNVYNDRASFRGSLLFTHRGISGPAILQISSYWKPGEHIVVDITPGLDVSALLRSARQEQPRLCLKNLLARYLPRRVVTVLVQPELADCQLAELSNRDISQVRDQLQQWQLRPNNTEGYRTAEVTLGGVHCDEVSSRTFESKKVAGLYFIGEVLDVTGHLGGYNFQWAWSSGWCAGQGV